MNVNLPVNRRGRGAGAKLRHGSRPYRQTLKFLLAFLLGVLLVTGEMVIGNWVQPTVAQSLRPESVAAEVYERLPDLPLANDYRSKEGEVASDNTLISRFVRYHQYEKDRPTVFRLDWKLTLSDYLGANEPIVDEARYPGYSTLQTSPRDSDIEAIRQLNLRQRNELVDVLISIYDPNGSFSFASDQTPSEPTPSEGRRSPPNLPKPGEAELLLP